MYPRLRLSVCMCVTAVVSENLLAGLGKCHPGKGRGEGFRVHLAARALQVIILPRLSVRRLKHQPTRPHVIKPFMIHKCGRAPQVATGPLPRRRVSARHICVRVCEPTPFVEGIGSSFYSRLNQTGVIDDRPIGKFTCALG